MKKNIISIAFLPILSYTVNPAPTSTIETIQKTIASDTQALIKLRKAASESSTIQTIDEQIKELNRQMNTEIRKILEKTKINVLHEQLKTATGSNKVILEKRLGEESRKIAPEIEKVKQPFRDKIKTLMNVRETKIIEIKPTIKTKQEKINQSQSNLKPLILEIQKSKKNSD